MQYFANHALNGGQINITMSDSLAVILTYGRRLERPTAWTFADKSKHQSHLSLASIEANDGVHTTVFVPQRTGVCDIIMCQRAVLQLPGKGSEMATYTLRVVVLEG
jgi:hypothetical protein